MYFFTVFLDASVWADMVIIGRCWLYIFSIFLILLMLIVKLAMLYKWYLPPQALAALQHLLQQSGGHHLPEHTGQKPAEPVVSLNRKGMVMYIRISTFEFFIISAFIIYFGFYLIISIIFLQ